MRPPAVAVVLLLACAGGAGAASININTGVACGIESSLDWIEPSAGDSCNASQIVQYQKGDTFHLWAEASASGQATDTSMSWSLNAETSGNFAGGYTSTQYMPVARAFTRIELTYWTPGPVRDGVGEVNAWFDGGVGWDAGYGGVDISGFGEGLGFGARDPSANSPFFLDAYRVPVSLGGWNTISVLATVDALSAGDYTSGAAAYVNGSLSFALLEVDGGSVPVYDADMAPSPAPVPAPAPVPEPGTWAMLLSGLGVLVSRRAGECFAGDRCIQVLDGAGAQLSGGRVRGSEGVASLGLDGRNRRAFVG